MIHPFRKRVETRLSERVAGLSDWLQSDAGKTLVNSERTLLEQELTTIFGFHAGQLSISWQEDLLATTRVRRQFILTGDPLQDAPRAQIHADPLYWPVAPGSLDLVLLQHTLEVADSPHRLLSEAANTIIPDGKLILFGFNPYSLGSLARHTVPGYRKELRDVHFLSAARLKDWLALLNFSVEKVIYGGYLYPMNLGIRGDVVASRLEQGQWPLGSFYMMVATRETPGLTPIHKVWSDVRRRFVGQPHAGPSAGRVSKH